jgi:hypothetical protein
MPDLRARANDRRRGPRHIATASNYRLRPVQYFQEKIGIEARGSSLANPFESAEPTR